MEAVSVPFAHACTVLEVEPTMCLSLYDKEREQIKLCLKKKGGGGGGGDKQIWQIQHALPALSRIEVAVQFLWKMQSAAAGKGNFTQNL